MNDNFNVPVGSDKKQKVSDSPGNPYAKCTDKHKQTWMDNNGIWVVPDWSWQTFKMP